jgi:hypothetical protein
MFLKTVSTFWTILKILFGLIATAPTALIRLSAIPGSNLRQLPRLYLHLFPTGNGLSHLRIQFINRVAAARLHIIMSVPFEAWNKK